MNQNVLTWDFGCKDGAQLWRFKSHRMNKCYSAYIYIYVCVCVCVRVVVSSLLLIHNGLFQL